MEYKYLFCCWYFCVPSSIVYMQTSVAKPNLTYLCSVSLLRQQGRCRVAHALVLGAPNHLTLLHLTTCCPNEEGGVQLYVPWSACPEFIKLSCSFVLPSKVFENQEESAHLTTHSNIGPWLYSLKNE